MVKLSSVAEILNGDRSSNYPSGKDFVAFGIPFINAGHLTKGKIDFSNMDYISEQKYQQLSGAKIRKHDILLCLRGSLGKYAVSEIDAGAPASSIAVIRPDKSLIDAGYLTCIISSFVFQRQIDLENNGSSQPNLSASSVSSFTIPLPPVNEQQHIAEALSDVDSMISFLDKMIVKKKAIKQGAMQELLTGKKRLPGFTGKWRTINLGEISKIKTGDKNNEQKSEDGQYPFFVRSQQVERINSYSFDGEAILIPGEGNIGQIFHYINGKFDWHQRVYKISDFPEFICGKYVYYQMKFTFGEHALKNTVKATVDSLRLPTFESFGVLIPPTVEEQISIAAILSDLDTEIGSLEQKLAKARQIKQGMMQQLLTGKIRLA